MSLSALGLLSESGMSFSLSFGWGPHAFTLPSDKDDIYGMSINSWNVTEVNLKRKYRLWDTTPRSICLQKVYYAGLQALLRLRGSPEALPRQK